MKQITLILAIAFTILCVSCKEKSYKIDHTEFEIVDSTWVAEKSTIEPFYHFYRTNSGRIGSCNHQLYQIGDTIKYIYLK